MGLAAQPELWFLPFALIIGAWVAWSDLATMKIPNKAVLATLALFFLLGLVALPLDVWAWRWTHFGVLLVVGFFLSAAGGLGAGDAKFLAAIAPFVLLRDVGFFAMILATVSIVTFLAHRALRRTEFVRTRFAHLESVEHKKFPWGIALAPAWVIYLAIRASGA